MAICNLFRQLSKETGNFLLFSQYTDDLTKCFVQHDNYKIVPSKFVALELNYKNLKNDFRQSDDLNIAFPTYLQNYYENGCAWLKTESPDGNVVLGQSNWNPDNWNPKYAANLFWNALIIGGLIKVKTVGAAEGSPYMYDADWDGTNTSSLQSFESFNEIRYIGDLDIHSYEEKGGIGYSEIYCYIPNGAGQMLYKVTDHMTSQSSSHCYTYPADNDHQYIMGASAESENILGILPINAHSDGMTPPNYYYEQKYSFAAYSADGISYDGINNIRDYKEIKNSYVGGTPAANFFKFNTIVVLYDVLIKDNNGNITTAYKDIPMGMYLTGTIQPDGTVTNTVTKYSECLDAYGSGTSYGLRICTRFMCTPNATTISSTELDTCDQYAGFSMAMNKMAESQEKMDAIMNETLEHNQTIKDYLSEFRNGKTNVPYIRKIGTDYFWFVNGKNTGVHANGVKGDPGRNGTILQLVEYNGTYYWALDGEMTNIRAEGKDGLPGVPGDQGIPGEDGHSPILSIKEVTVKILGPAVKGRPRTSISKVEKHYFIDDLDTGVRADAPSVTVETYNDRKWLYIDGIRKVCVEGVDGFTPTIQTAANGKKYWFINGQTTGIQAEATDGKSIHVSKVKVRMAGTTYLLNSNGESWIPGDTVLYLGESTGKVLMYDIFKVGVFSGQYNLFTATKLGNICGKLTDNITDIDVRVNGNKMEMIINKDETNVHTFDNFLHRNIQYSTRQNKFVKINDKVYCCNTNDSKVYLEIPYQYRYEKVANSYNVYIQINDDRYQNKRGWLSILSTKLGLPVSSNSKVYRLAFSSTRYKTTTIVDGEEVTSWNDRDIPLDERGMDESQEIHVTTLSTNKKWYIWRGLTKDELNSIRNAYKISRHVGRVFLYVEMSSCSYLPKNSKGIMYFNRGSNSWVLEKTDDRCKVLRHNMWVDGYRHVSADAPKPIAHTFDEFVSMYDAKDLFFRARTKSFEKANGKKMYSSWDGINHHIDTRETFIPNTLPKSNKDWSGNYHKGRLLAWMPNRIRYDKYKTSSSHAGHNDSVYHINNGKFSKYKYRFIEYDNTRINIESGDNRLYRVMTYSNWCRMLMCIPTVEPSQNYTPQQNYTANGTQHQINNHYGKKLAYVGPVHPQCMSGTGEIVNVSGRPKSAGIWPASQLNRGESHVSPYLEVAVRNGSQYDVYEVRLIWRPIPYKYTTGDKVAAYGVDASTKIDDYFVNKNLNLGFLKNGQLIPYSLSSSQVSSIVGYSSQTKGYAMLDFKYKTSIQSIKETA